MLTSSVVSIYADHADCAERGGVLNESHWSECASLKYMPYNFAKREAERAAWRLAEAQSRWRLVVVNPGFVVGPSLTARRDSASIDFMLNLINGRRRSGIWETTLGWVDVRDVAIAHVEAASRSDAEGRHILVSENTSFWTVIRWLQEDFPGQLKLPRRRIPKWLSYVVGPLNGFSWRYVRRHVNHTMTLDNTRSRERLGLDYRPLRDTVREHVEQLIRDGLYTPPS